MFPVLPARVRCREAGPCARQRRLSVLHLHLAPLLVQRLARGVGVGQDEPVLVADAAQREHKVESPPTHRRVRSEEDDLATMAPGRCHVLYGTGLRQVEATAHGRRGADAAVRH